MSGHHRCATRYTGHGKVLGCRHSRLSCADVATTVVPMSYIMRIYCLWTQGLCMSVVSSSYPSSPRPLKTPLHHCGNRSVRIQVFHPSSAQRLYTPPGLCSAVRWTLGYEKRDSGSKLMRNSISPLVGP